MADEDLGNAITRRQFYLERYGNGLGAKINGASGDYETIAQIINSTRMTPTRKRQKITAEINKRRKNGQRAFIRGIKELWGAELKWMQTWLPDEVEVPKVDSDKLIRTALNKPMVDNKGMTPAEMNDRVWTSAEEQTTSLVRSATYYSLTREEVSTQFAAISAQFERGMKASARTSVFAVSNQVRDTMYKANDDIIEGVVMSAILDGRTTLFCLNIDGTIVPLDSTLRPPFHVNCRTIALPVFEDETTTEVKEVLANRKQVVPGKEYQKGDNTLKTTRGNIEDESIRVKTGPKSGQSGAEFLASQRNSAVGRQFLKDTMGVVNSKKFMDDIKEGKSPKVSLRQVLNDQSDLDIDGLIKREKR